VKRGFIIDRNLLTWTNVAKCQKEDVAIDYFHVAVGFARVVDVMRAVASAAAVQAPAIIDSADPKSSSPRSAVGFRVGYPLARVLGYLPAAFKWRL